MTEKVPIYRSKSWGDQVKNLPNLFGEHPEQKYYPSTPVHYAFATAPETMLIVKPTGVTLTRVPNRRLIVMDGSDPGINHLCQSVEELKEFKRQLQPNSNKAGRVKSGKSVKRIKNSVGQLVLMSAEKQAKSLKYKDINFNFRVNFVTLTLPCLQFHKDSTIKKECLNQFLTEIRQSGVKNFVWVCENQVNGNIHFHFATDTYIHHSDINRRWNRIINKLGYVDKYRQKFQAMTMEQYLTQYGKYTIEKLQSRYDKLKKAGIIKVLTFQKFCSLYPEHKTALRDLKARYIKGVSNDWSSPNTTDIHSIYQLRNVASYMSKYMTKTPDEVTFYNSMELTREQKSAVTYSLKARKTNGRVWGCSQSISSIPKEVGRYKVVEGSKLDWKKANLVLNAVRERFPDKVFDTDFSKHVSVNVVDLEPLLPKVFKDIREQIKAFGYTSGVSPN